MSNKKRKTVPEPAAIVPAASMAAPAKMTADLTVKKSKPVAEDVFHGHDEKAALARAEKIGGIVILAAEPGDLDRGRNGFWSVSKDA